MNLIQRIKNWFINKRVKKVLKFIDTGFYDCNFYEEDLENEIN